MYDTDQYLFAAARVGAAAYLLKSMADEEIVDACHAALGGARFRYPGTVGTRTRERLEQLQRGEEREPHVLTPREVEVLKLVAEGHSSQEIATILVISIKTVERHRANIIEKLGIRDRVSLARYAIRQGLVEP
jgi:DNA-binding NarL/FixJ family response regulator